MFIFTCTTAIIIIIVYQGKTTGGSKLQK